jgi:HAD superfamily hydrolase (TIGR01549 family)
MIISVLKAVIFDLENTLVEIVYEPSQEAILRDRALVREKFLELGVPEEVVGSVKWYTLLYNKSLDWMEENRDEAGIKKFVYEFDKFIKTFEMVFAENTRVFSETLEVLTNLYDEGVEMAIATNTSRLAANHILEKWSLTGFFDVVVTRSDVPRLKPDPSMIHTAASRMKNIAGWFVGDSSSDALAARNAGLKSIIVRRGKEQPQFECDFLIRSLSELISIMSEF